jgi:hypothetical protein
MASAIRRFTDQENCAAILERLFSQKIDSEPDAVEDGGAVIAQRNIVNCQR